jgi:uncharacterized damage-inducible protein DinB
MRRIVIALLFLLSLTIPMMAQDAAAPTATDVANRQLSGLESEFVPLAEAMPEDKYSYAPTNGEFKGVRTFGEQMRHVAATNYMIAASILGEKVPVDLGKGENGPDLKTKAEIVKFLKDSFAYTHKAFASINNSNAFGQVDNPFGGKNKPARMGLVVLAVSHSFDHYGQSVVYLRSNGIIPPASRQQ